MPDDLTVETTKDGSMTYRSSHYAQTYHSTFGALTEARQVYLQNSGVMTRLSQCQPTRVLEIGFGLGLNTLLTVDQALICHSPLEYVAYDRRLVDVGSLQQLDYRHLLDHGDSADKLYAAMSTWSNAPSTRYRFAWREDIALQLHVGDVTRATIAKNHFDAIYLDAFSPAHNPECWTPTFLKQLALALRPGGTLATYCVQGAVRRTLLQSGLIVRKHKGPPGKRETLSATCPL